MRYKFFILAISVSFSLFPATWNTNVNNSDWNVNGNWTTPAIFPQNIGDDAILGTVITGNRNIILGQNITIGTLEINSTHNYTITAANTLNFQVSSGTASLLLDATNTGASTIASSLQLGSSFLAQNSGISNFTISGAITNPSGTNGITVNSTGTGSLLLSSSSNAFSFLTITQGNTVLETDGAIPGATPVTIGQASGGTGTLVIAAAMTAPNAFPAIIDATGILAPNVNRTVYLSSLQGSGSLALTTGTANTNFLEITGSNDSVFSGVISGGADSASSNPASGNRLIWDSAATFTLSGSSTYVSRTFITQGIIDVQSNMALGDPGPNSAVYVQATGMQGSLNIDGNGLDLPKTLFLNGPGYSTNGGALRNTGGNNTVSGIVHIGWSGGTEVASAATISVDPSTQLSLTGLLTGTSDLTVTGGGTLIYSPGVANTFSGTTTIMGSTTLDLNGTSGNTQVGPVSVNSGTLLLSLDNQIGDTVVVTLGGGTFNLNSFSETIGSLLFNSGSVTNGTVLNLSSTAATALSMNDSTNLTQNIAFTAAGGVTYIGSTGTATISGGINLGTTSHIFDIPMSTAGVSMNISGIISGSTGGDIVMSTGTGILEFSGTQANTYSGTTTLNAGQLTLGKSSGVVAISGNSIVNAGGTLLLNADEQILDTSTLTLSGGIFNMDSYTETIGELIFTSGTLTQESGSNLKLSSNATALSMTGTTISGMVSFTGTGGITTNASATTALLSGVLDLGTSGHTFTIANGGANPDLNISGIIQGETGGSFTKAGAGMLTLSGMSPNTYTGLTMVSAGTLTLDASAVAISGNASLTGGTLTNAAGGQIANTSTVTLAGGTWNLGTFTETISELIFDSGTFTATAATLNLESNTTMLMMQNRTLPAGLSLFLQGTGDVVFDNTNNGTATIDGPINLNGQNVNFNIGLGSAATEDMNIAGVISNGALTKTGAGRLNFSVANSYTGLTTVTAGELRLGTAANTAAIAGNILINGGTLLIVNNNQINNSSTITLSSGAMTMTAGSVTINNLVYDGGTFTATGRTLTLESSGTALEMQGVTITGGTVSLAGTTGGDVVFDNSNNGTANLNAVNLGTQIHNFIVPHGTASIDMIVNGVISGAGGGITKIGNGVLEFAGPTANTYTGLTTVTAGELLLNQATGNAIAGNILINGGNLVLGHANQIANGSIVTLSSGTFNLNDFAERINTLNYDGGMLIQNSGLLSLLTLSMRNTTVSGDIAMIGAGTVAFDSTNNGTAMIAGNLNLGGFAISFTIADGTAESDMLISGTISNGSITKIGAGKLTLTGANTYAGGTTVTAGTLQGDTTSLQGTIFNNANLIFDQTTEGTFNGTLSGSGNLVVEGGGILTLATVNSVSTPGVTTVDSDTKLIVNDTFGGASTMTVASGATLGGTGPIIQDLTLFGTLSPGNSIGTISFIGDQTFAGGSTLDIEITPTSNDLVSITGTLEIQPGSRLLVEPSTGMYSPSVQYTIVQTTAGVNGTFSMVTASLPMFHPSVSYTPDTVLLGISFFPFSELVTKGNAAEVAHCLDAAMVIPGSNLANVINVLHMLPTINAVKKALNQMQPSLFTSLAIAQEDDTLYVNNALIGRLDDLIHSCRAQEPPDHPWKVWATVLGGNTHQKNRAKEPGFTSLTPGGLIGIDKIFGSSGILGVSAAYTYSDLHWKNHRGHADINTIYGALYGSLDTKHGFLEGSILGGYNFYYTNREIQFGTGTSAVRRMAKGNHHGAETAAQLKGGYRFITTDVHLSPFLAFDYIYLHEDGFTEHGAKSLDLTLKKKNSDLLISQAGIDFSNCMIYGSITFTPFIEISVVRESRFRGNKIHALFNEVCSLDVRGLYPSRTLGQITGGFHIGPTDRPPYITLYYNGRFASHFTDQSISLQGMYSF